MNTCHELQVCQLARGKGLDAALASHLVERERESLGEEEKRESERERERQGGGDS